MKFALNQFSFSQDILVKYCRAKGCRLIDCDPEKVYQFAVNSDVDLTNPSNYCLNFANIALSGEKNEFYYKVVRYFQKKYQLECDLSEATLYCIFIPFFKNPMKYRKKNEFIFSNQDIHRQLYLMKKFNFYSNEKSADELVERLNYTYGIPFFSKAELNSFVEELKAV